TRSDVKPQYVHRLAPNPAGFIPTVQCTAVIFTLHTHTHTQTYTLHIAYIHTDILTLSCVSVSSPCVHGMQCGDGSCVWESQWCDGVTDCPAGQDEANCVRLHGSSFLLQIYSTQTKTWRTVCSHGWTEQQGRASCQTVGYSRSRCSGVSQRLLCEGLMYLIKAVLTMMCRASGGQQASLGSWPWRVSLQVAGSHRCGGAIISPFWILTAAHCVARASSSSDWAVYAGIVDALGTLFNPAYSVSRIIAHEDYKSHTRRNDIALMRLTKPLDVTASSNIRPVCLPNVGLNFSAPQKAWITQFGHAANGGKTATQVSLIETAECNSSIAYNGRISQDMLCAREMEAGTGMCHSDSGGPLLSLTNGLWWLTGDSIWGEHCAEQNKPGVYGNVTYFLDWIYRQMKVQTHQSQTLLQLTLDF
uniref:Transmembrane serine protease 2 n=1 Tax=Seriola dumerili TaxID=41447 RepID=A0A3B4UD47_SERDU